MLETVRKALIECSDGVPFELFFNAYIMNVQDANIVAEVKHTITIHNATVLDIERLAHEEHRKLVN